MTELGEALSSIDLKEMGRGLIGFGIKALIASVGLSALGNAMYRMGVGLQLANENLKAVTDGLKSLIDQVDIKDTGLGKLGLELFKFGIFASMAANGISSIGDSFSNMGNGISTINDEAEGAIQQLQSLKDFLMSEDLAGISQNFTGEIDKINNSLSSLSGGGVVQAQARLEQNVTQQASVENRQEAPDQRGIIGEIQVTNTILGDIKEIVTDMKGLMGTGQQSQQNRTIGDSTSVQPAGQ